MGKRRDYAIAAALAVVTFVVVAILLSIVLFQPRFTIVSHNKDVDLDWDEDFNPIYTLTVYVKIENLGIDGSKTV